MVETEQYFPRGGEKPKRQFSDKKKFDFLGNADRIGKKRKYRAPKINLDDNDEEDVYLSDKSDDSEHRIKSISAQGICLGSIQEGMVILGRVLLVYDTKVLISLPGKMVGTVMANNISAPYTSLLKSFVDGKAEEIKKPTELFHVGEYVSVKVLSISSESSKRTIALSLTPQDVNSGLYFSNLREGMLLRAAVGSIEDHGYVLDLGIANTRLFLPKKLTDDSHVSLDVGQVIWCTIKKCQTSGTNSIVTVTSSLDVIKSSSISGNAVNNHTIGNLKPGMALGFSVNKPLLDGVEGYILKDTLGYIHASQIDSKLSIGQKVNARLLYVMPVSKLPFFTIRKIFNSFTPDMEEETRLKVGQICETAKVMKVFIKSVILKMGKKDVGVLHLKSYKGNDAQELYPLGSEHRVRILSYNMSDYSYLCTDDQQVLEQKYFNLNDLSIGQHVVAVVEDVLDKYVSVKVGSLKGRIPELHVSEVGAARNHDKKPASKVWQSFMKKKYKSGQELRARVLRLDPATSIFHLTVKPSLMDPQTPILANIEDARIGEQYRGVVVCHLQFGILVAFFGEVKAFVHVSQLSHDFIQDISSAFYLGQVVKCTITSVDNDRVNGSLIKQPYLANKPDEKKDVQKVKQRKVEDVSDNETKCKKSKGVRSDIDDIQVDTTEFKMKKKANEKIEETVDEKKKKKQTKLENEKIKRTSKELRNDGIKGRKREEENVGYEEPVKMKHNGKKKKTNDNSTNIEEGVVDNIQEDNHKKRNRKCKDTTSSDKRTNNEFIVEDGGVFKKKKTDNDEMNVNKDTVSKFTSVKEEMKCVENGDLKFSSMSNFFDLGPTTPFKRTAKGNSESTSESDGEMAEEQSKKKKKKLSATEKVERARQEEQKLRAIENELADASSQPKSSDQFERLLLANPNSSELWIAYMAFHLQATEIERARAVGQKALKTISFREEQDKLNVCLALLNLENRFGTQESLSSTLQQALEANDPFGVHSKMLAMYVDTGKVQDVLSLVDIMVAKYKSNPQMYTVTGDVCYKINAMDKARSIMQKAVTRLEYKAHVPVLIKFAQMENNHGDMERAEAMFEQLIGCLPQRVDIWCIYIDMLLKSCKIDSVRLVMERAVSQKLPLKRMKLLYKKWIDIEEKSGDSDHVENVRRMALEFVNKIKC